MFQDRLNELRSAVPGVQAVSLVAGDGISIASVGGEDLDLEVLSAETVAMARGISSEQRALGLGEALRFEVAAENSTLILTRVREGYYLLLALEADRPAGRARFELVRAALHFADDLS